MLREARKKKIVEIIAYLAERLPERCMRHATNPIAAGGLAAQLTHPIDMSVHDVLLLTNLGPNVTDVTIAEVDRGIALETQLN